jgi:hypothetical protein
MDLKEFISSSLTQIVEGIRDAQERSTGSGAWISPLGDNMPSRAGAQHISSVGGYQYLDEVKFDVTISVTEEISGGAKGSLKIMSVAIGAGGEIASQHGAVSRVQFAVPVVWPESTNEQREKQIAASRATTEAKMKAATGRHVRV